jgi:hypothetical protein
MKLDNLLRGLPDDAPSMVGVARAHLAEVARLSATDLDDYGVAAGCTDDEAEADIEGEIEKHFLAACAIVLVLMGMGCFEEARTVQTEISAWVMSQTEDDITE